MMWFKAITIQSMMKLQIFAMLTSTIKYSVHKRRSNEVIFDINTKKNYHLFLNFEYKAPEVNFYVKSSQVVKSPNNPTTSSNNRLTQLDQAIVKTDSSSSSNVFKVF